MLKTFCGDLPHIVFIFTLSSCNVNFIIRPINELPFILPPKSPQTLWDICGHTIKYYPPVLHQKTPPLTPLFVKKPHAKQKS